MQAFSSLHTECLDARHGRGPGRRPQPPDGRAQGARGLRRGAADRAAARRGPRRRPARAGGGQALVAAARARRARGVGAGRPGAPAVRRRGSAGALRHGRGGRLRPAVGDGGRARRARGPAGGRGGAARGRSAGAVPGPLRRRRAGRPARRAGAGGVAAHDAGGGRRRPGGPRAVRRPRAPGRQPQHAGSARGGAAVSGAPDVAVIGGGIVGCALAAFLAEDGARVRLYEREAVAAGASGRNSGVVQHPLDAALTGLYAESLEHYRRLGHGFTLPEDPVGLLVVADRPDALGPPPAEFPELRPQLLSGAELRAAEPALADGLVAHRLDTGRPVPPAAAARAFAARARAAGAELLIGDQATLAAREGRALGVTVRGALHPAGAVAVAAGPWTPAAGARVPIAPLWGVVVEVALPTPPTHVLEEAGVDELTGSDVPGSLFSMV